MPELITIERAGPVATLTLNRPELHNAFNAELIAGLHEACEELRRDAGLRVLLLRGAGPSFCAGADMRWMRASLDYSHEENLADADRLDAMLDALDSLPLAVVGLAHGASLGGGLGLLCCCDVVIAAEGATFGLTEARLGLLPAVIGRFVVRRVGPGHARALFVGARRFGAQRALQIGLVHEVVADGELDEAGRRAAQELLRCGPQAVAASKALVRALTELPGEEARRYAVEAIAAARTGPEGQEGLRAFLEKRTPDWVG